MLYRIPKIKWQVTNHGQIRTADTVNTFVDYSIKLIDNEIYCFYGNGRHKLFKSIEEAREWVETIHYPAQVNKYLERIDDES